MNVIKHHVCNHTHIRAPDFPHLLGWVSGLERVLGRMCTKRWIGLVVGVEYLVGDRTYGVQTVIEDPVRPFFDALTKDPRWETYKVCYAVVQR